MTDVEKLTVLSLGLTALTVVSSTLTLGFVWIAEIRFGHT
jgi:hypothetical protein